MLKRLTRLVTKSFLLLGVLLLVSRPSEAQGVQVVVENPALHPLYNNDCSVSNWYPFMNNRGYTAYLTMNVNNPGDSTNYAEWHPQIPQSGYYRIEAYIASHLAIDWCVGNHTDLRDTTDAHYSIHSARGTTTRSLSQYPLSNQWLNLGEYYFEAGTSGYVHLTDLNGETPFTTTISFSAMRFTFTRTSQPTSFLPLLLYTNSVLPASGKVGVIQDQGFDACHLPEISEMKSWWDHSPYAFYGLYLGGIHLSSYCTRPSAAWVSAVHQQGWSFVPTWVGLQAPCSTWKYKMSSDPSVSYQQGRQEAEAASSAAASMGLSNSASGGTIIYYDMEAYGVSTPACRQPVSAFINGWVERLHELGNLAGAYGTRSTYPADWAYVANPPDDIWAASWYASSYDPYASVKNISWIEGLWTNHQRIRQYAGDVGNTWGSVSLAIDIDVADGVVALPPLKTKNASVISSTRTIEDAGWVSPNQGWVVSASRLYLTTDHAAHWQDISPTPVQAAYFISTGDAWALSAENSGGLTLYRSSNWGKNWESSELSLPAGTWHPLQVEFTSPSSGWMVLQLETSQAFDTALLVKTSDGASTWQSYPLPGAARIQFISAEEGWLIDRLGGALHHTTDGGLTWQLARPGSYTLSQPAVPGNTLLSGWQSADLGWAATSTGTCTDEASGTGLTCQVENSLWQTVDAGQTWQIIPAPDPVQVVP